MKNEIRKLLYRLTGINSISSAVNPVTYLDDFFFRVIVSSLRYRVSAGKFKGIRLEYLKGGSEYKPKLVGTYENELDYIFRKFLSSSCKWFIDLGSDDGYYALGAAHSRPDLKAVAIECCPIRCKHIERNIINNNLEQQIKVVNRKIEDGNHLVQFIKTIEQPVLIKCDIEGGEYQIFDRPTLEFLAHNRALIIIETHISNDLEMNLVDSMRSAGYLVKIIERGKIKSINTKDFPVLPYLLCRLFAQRWTNEHRPSFNRWVVAEVS